MNYFITPPFLISKLNTFLSALLVILVFSCENDMESLSIDSENDKISVPDIYFPIHLTNKY
jgi:hypothetical protein